MPTSITAAPGFTISAVTMRGCPTALTTTSARRTKSARFSVREWQMVTVQFSRSSIMARGFPTMFERPTTTAFAPDSGTPASFRSRTQPAGVHGSSGARPRSSRPALIGWKPSTSFSGATEAVTRSEFMPRGSGSCTRMPLIDSSAFSRAISESTSSSVAVSGRRTVTERIPTQPHAFCLFAT